MSTSGKSDAQRQLVALRADVVGFGGEDAWRVFTDQVWPQKRRSVLLTLAPGRGWLLISMYSQSKLSSVNTTADPALQRDIEDVLAPRRVSDEQFVNLPGVDGGQGSAGNIPIDPGREARIAEAPSSNTLVAHHDESIRIFGPYWTSAAAVVLVGEFHSTEWPRGFRTLCSRAAVSIGERASREHRVFLGRAP